MRKVVFALLSLVMLVGCKSREEKVTELLNDYMFKNLADYESYEPIDTRIDSMYTSIYTDSVIVHYANEMMTSLFYAGGCFDDAEDEHKYENIGYDPVDTFMYYASNIRLIEKGEQHLKDAHRYKDSIRLLCSKFKTEFYGWKVHHRYRSKNKDGNFELEEECFLIDKGFKRIETEIAFSYRLNICMYITLKEYVDKAVNNDDFDDFKNHVRADTIDVLDLDKAGLSVPTWD